MMKKKPLLLMMFLGFATTSHADDLYLIGKYKPRSSGLNQTYEGERETYLLLKQDSTYVKAIFPINGFGQRVWAEYSEKGRWNVLGDSLILSGTSCSSSGGKCSAQGEAFKFSLDTIHVEGSKKLNNGESADILKKLDNSEAETKTRSQANGIVYLLLGGVVLAMFLVAK